MPTKVVVIGSYAVALVMDVEHIPLTGETVLAQNFRQTWGGKGSDTAVQAVRLGADVEFVGVIGSDAYGDEFVRLMRKEGVGIGAVRRSLKMPTGAGFIIKDHNGNNIISVDMGANSLLDSFDIDRAQSLLDQADVVLAQLEVPLESALYGLARAKHSGARTVLNPAPGRDLMECDLSMVDVLTPNSTEVRVCTGQNPDADIDELEACSRLRSLGCRSVVLTRGEGGALLVDGNGMLEIEAPEISVVDTNGAGDAFSAALGVALGEGRSVAECVAFANVVAGLSCTAWETIDSYHDRRTVDLAVKTGLDQ